MEENARYAVGVDVGTNTVRAVMGKFDKDGSISVVGYGEAPSEGIRRGRVKELATPPSSIDACLKAVEAMSGINVTSATVSINGSHIASTKIDGMIAVGVADHEIDAEDLRRIEETAIAGKIPANRETLALIPYEYILDGQGGIREPLGMHGARLEIRANVISALTPDCDNMRKIFENDVAGVKARILEPTVTAAARAVLTSRQMENGVGVVDMGGSTTGVAIYDEGELQFAGVVPIGSNDVTNDLATVLKTVPEIAEEIKVRFASGRFGETDKDVIIKRGREEYKFSRKEVDEVVEARLEEIFEGVRHMLKMAGYDKRLPEGLVLVGGGSKLRDIEVYARDQVELAVRLGKPEGILGVSEEVMKPEYSAAVGLMMLDAAEPDMDAKGDAGSKKKSKKNKADGESWLKRLLKNFK
ncbi:MAG: cell division protein FtsA [Candidatus Saccharibacteria bacterium]|nr:cell division protein FtsA [Candidatus Saccharibacteria bacterium]